MIKHAVFKPLQTPHPNGDINLDYDQRYEILRKLLHYFSREPEEGSLIL